ncbi:hypothetical protein ACFQZE_21710 [Paenibacillus sp. GCM10027627]|uniref:hypothetical protein n=1 Tax=unclassified Paenibacillus TaxID=185978 RepID=UPI0036445919
MMKVAMVAVCAALFSFLIWKRNRHEHGVMEAVWPIVLLWGAAALMVLLLLHVPISPPTDWITALMSPLYKPVVAWVKGGASS